MSCELHDPLGTVKTLDHKENMYFNLEPMSILDIFMSLYKGSS